MPDPSDQQTRESDRPPPTPAEGDTLDAPAPPEPGTRSALTHSGNDAEPLTATTPRVGTREPFPDPPGFVIVREVGSGGMGVVYEARQAQLNRAVALKVLKGGRGDTNAVIRFLAEAQAVAAITHPHVVQVFGSGQADAGPYMVLELLTGGTLSDKLRGTRMTPRAGAELLVKLAGAVQAAHDLGIVHRDLKPSNVLFDSAGEPKVTDFGLAKKTGGTDLTHTNALMGTPAYMAPEQARGETKFVGPPADVWALGAILYECLTGKRAFDADDTWGTLRKVTAEAPPAPRAHVPDLPRDLELIALKCLEKAPADRYPSAGALAADLENYLAGRPVSVRPAGPVERLTKWAKRNPTVAALTASVALALVIGSVVSLAFGLQAHRRGEQLAGANADLTRTNADLQIARDEQAALAAGLKVARDDLAAKATDLVAANEAAAERGYLSDVALAHQLWKANDLHGMRAALARCPPERRRWEWHHLDRLSRPEKDVLATDSLPLALAYSPGGKWLAYLTLSNTLTVIDRATGRERHTIPGDKNRLQREASIAFHPMNSELAYVAASGVRVVELTTGRFRDLKGPDGETEPGRAVTVGYTPDGRLLVASEVTNRGPERHFAIYDALAGKKLSSIPAFTSPTGSIAQITSTGFSPDGKLFAVSAVDSGISVRGPNDHPKAADTFVPRVFVWEVRSGKLVAQPETGSSLLGHFAFDADSGTVAFGRGADVTEFALGPKQSSRQITGHTGEVNALAYDRNGLVWSGGANKLILAHDRKTGAERFALRGCPHGMTRLAVSPDGKEVAAAVGDGFGSAGAIYRFDAAALAADVWRSPATRERISSVVAVAPDGVRFAALDFVTFDERPESRRFVTRDLTHGRESATPATALWVRGAMAPDGRVFVLERARPADRQERVRVIGADGTTSHTIEPPADAEQGPQAGSVVACTPDGRTLAVSSARTTNRTKFHARLATWDPNTRAPRESGEVELNELVPNGARFPELLPTCATADREGRRLATTFVAVWQPEGQARLESRGIVLVWDLSTGKELFRKIIAVELFAAVFDSQGRLAVAGGGPTGGAVFGWDVATGAEFLSLRGHTRPILSLVFGPGDRLFTGGADRVVKVWDPASKREVLSLDGFAREVTHLAFAPDGKQLVAATGFDLFGASAMGGTPRDSPPAEVRAFRGPK